MSYRAGEISHHRWLIERKAQILRDLQEQEAEAKRKLEEKQRLVEKAKTDRLLREAAAFRQARDIRQYVADVLATLQADSAIEEQEAAKRWATWALVEANRIDPVASGKFLAD